MAASTEKEPAEEREGSLWVSFSQADMRLFLVTFAGTVAANIVTVMVVAVALIASRPANGGRPTVGSVLIDLFCVISGVMTVGIGVAAFRYKGRRDTTSRTITVMIASVTVFMGLLASVYLLILLGYAVDVK